MNEKDFDKISSQVTKGVRTATLGYQITKRQFEIITILGAQHVHKWGYGEYVRYMETWKLKIR